MKKPKHYTSISDMPQYNWRMISETNDLTYMLVNRGQMANKHELKQAFDIVYSQYIDEFGINDNYLRILELQADLWVNKIEVEVNKNRFAENAIDQINIELSELLKPKNKVSAMQGKVYLDKHMGFRINEKEVSVLEYGHYMKEMNRDLARQRR